MPRRKDVSRRKPIPRFEEQARPGLFQVKASRYGRFRYGVARSAWRRPVRTAARFLGDEKTDSGILMARGK